MIDILQKNMSSDQRLNDDDFSEFDEETDNIIDQPCGIRLYQ